MPESRNPALTDAVPAAGLRRGGAWDRAGIVVSGLCLVHCLAGLILVGVLGLGGEVLLNPAIHRVGLVAAIGIAGATIGANALRGPRGAPLLALMVAAVVAGHGAAEVLLTMTGVALVAAAHVANMRHSRHCGC